MIKEPSIFLGHILENILDVEEFTKEITISDFLKNKEKQNAVIRSLEVIGEASKNISSEIKTKSPNIPWKEIAGTRDKITHHYFGVDLKLIWKVVKENLPLFKKRDTDNQRSRRKRTFFKSKDNSRNQRSKKKN